MKYKTTMKAVKAGYANIISIGYCDMQELLRPLDPTAYTTGIYGWNADIYSFGPNAIVTGYRPFGNVHPSATLQNKYKRLSKDLDEELKTSDLDYYDKEEKRYTLAKKFIREAIEEAKNA